MRRRTSSGSTSFASASRARSSDAIAAPLLPRRGGLEIGLAALLIDRPQRAHDARAHVRGRLGSLRVVLEQRNEPPSLRLALAIGVVALEAVVEDVAHVRQIGVPEERDEVVLHGEVGPLERLIAQQPAEGGDLGGLEPLLECHALDAVAEEQERVRRSELGVAVDRFAVVEHVAAHDRHGQLVRPLVDARHERGHAGGGLVDELLRGAVAKPELAERFQRPLEARRDVGGEPRAREGLLAVMLVLFDEPVSGVAGRRRRGSTTEVAHALAGA